LTGAGLNQLVHYPLVGGELEWQWVLNLVVWLSVFAFGAVRLFRSDTARV
jgi:ABC-2 type transport system permease protein